MKSPLIQPDINYCGVYVEFKLIDVLCSIRRECGSRCMGRKISDGKWRHYAQDLMGFKPHELDTLEQGEPRDFLTFILILSKMV